MSKPKKYVNKVGMGNSRNKKVTATYVGLYGSGLFNFVPTVTHTFRVLTSLHNLSLLLKMFLFPLLFVNISFITLYFDIFTQYFHRLQLVRINYHNINGVCLEKVRRKE